MISRVVSAVKADGKFQKIVIETAKTTTSLPRIAIIGLPRSEVKESKERILSAFKQSGVVLPRAKVTINLQPVNVPKKGSSLDLALAISLLQVHNLIPHTNLAAVGELSLNGQILPVNGQFGLLESAAQKVDYVWSSCLGREKSSLEKEFSWLKKVHEAADLKSVITLSTGGSVESASASFLKNNSVNEIGESENKLDQLENLPKWFSASLLKTIELILVGGHHCLLFGSPGVGKSFSQTVIEYLKPELLLIERWFRAKNLQPESISNLRPYLISLRPRQKDLMLRQSKNSVSASWLDRANQGLLFLDEIIIFKKDFLELLSYLIDHNRQNNRFTCLATANPCPCGFYGYSQCRCTPEDIKRHFKNLPGNLLDRFPVHWRTSDQDLRSMSLVHWQTSRRKIQLARQRQGQRHKDGLPLYTSLYSWEDIAQTLKKQSQPRRLIPPRDQLKTSWRETLRLYQIAISLADLDNKEVGQNHLEMAQMFCGNRVEGH